MATAESKELATQIPEYLRNLAGTEGRESGLEDLEDSRLPPFLKICRRDNNDPIFEGVPVGEVYLSSGFRVAGNEEPFYVTPIYSWNSWAIHNPWQSKGLIPFIREQTLDKDSELAARAKVQEEFPCPEKPEYNCKYVTHLNFLCVLQGAGELFGKAVSVSFYMGESRTGQRLKDLITHRKQVAPEMYAHIFEFKTGLHTSKAGNNPPWVGFDIGNPSAEYIDQGGSKYATESQFNQFKELHEKAKENREKLLLNFEEESGTSVEDATGSDTIG